MQSVGNLYLGPMKWIIPVLVAASTFGAVNGCAFSNGRQVFLSTVKHKWHKLLVSDITETCFE